MLHALQALVSFRPTRETSVGAVVFLLREGAPQFLLLHYPHGHWDFVKGHKERGETDEETLRRELEEETGITDVEIVSGFTSRVKFRYTAKGTEREKRRRQWRGLFIWKTVRYYAVRTNEAAVRLSDEHLDWSWLGYDDARRAITHENSKRVLDEAMRELQLTVNGLQ